MSQYRAQRLARLWREQTQRARLRGADRAMDTERGRGGGLAIRGTGWDIGVNL